MTYFRVFALAILAILPHVHATQCTNTIQYPYNTADDCKAAVMQYGFIFVDTPQHFDGLPSGCVRMSQLHLDYGWNPNDNTGGASGECFSPPYVYGGGNCGTNCCNEVQYNGATVVKIAPTVTTIEEYAFSGMCGITAVDFTDASSLVSIGSGCFRRVTCRISPYCGSFRERHPP